MALVGDLRTVLREPHFGRLYATRLTSQAADGMFQASLASAVFFSPERSTDAAHAAAGFTVLLLPYSLVGPFAGVLLDRWRRQRVLVVANAVRATLVILVAGLVVSTGPTAAGFYIAALAAISVNRFYLAALSAALPHVVPRPLLVMANSVSTTSGFVATLFGGLLGLGARGGVGGGDGGSGLVALLGAGGYLAASLVASGFTDPDLLGPEVRRARAVMTHALADVLRGLAAGARHLLERPPAAYALAAITAHRFCYGLSTIATLLLYRNYFIDDAVLRAGLPGLGQVLAASGLGVLIAAMVTPAVTARLGKERWVAGVFGLAAVVEATLGPPYTKPTLLAAALLLGFVAQASKICVDATLQETVAETMRGRVFSLYDTGFNLAFVGAAAAGALVLPSSGRSYAVLAGIAVGYAAIGVGYAVLTSRAPGHGPSRVAG